jgi:hypothetical protein
MTLPHIKAFSILSLGGLALFALATSARADQVSREQDIVDLRLGQRIQVDDGSCPAGQIKVLNAASCTGAVQHSSRGSAERDHHVASSIRGTS